MTNTLKHYAYFNEQNQEAAKGYKATIFALRPFLSETSRVPTKFRIVETTKEKSKSGIVTYEVRHIGRNPGSNPMGVQQVLEELARLKGDKKLVQRRELNVHRALNEANVREAFEQVMQNVMMHSGRTKAETESAFLDFAREVLGSDKHFDATALTEITSVVKKLKTKDITPEHRREVFLEIQAGRLGKEIQHAGYNPLDTRNESQAYALVESERTDSAGKRIMTLRRAAKDNAEKPEKSLTAAQALTASGHVQNPVTKVWEYRPSAEQAEKDAKKKAKSKAAAASEIYVVGGAGAGSRGPRGPDADLAKAQAFLRANNVTDGIINKLGVAKAKELARSMGWTGASTSE